MADLALFSKKHPQELSNINSDPILPNTKRNEFFTYFTIIPEADYEDLCKSFFSNNQFLGPQIILGDNEILGRVSTHQALAGQIAVHLGIDYDDALVILQSWHYITLKDFLDDLKSRKLENCHFCAGNVWGYRNPNNQFDPFDAVDTDDLICRLGLEFNYRKGPSSGFGYILPFKISVRQPTAFDAGFYPAWRPGGKTEPLGKCGSNCHDGLPEIIHSAIPFSSINSQIRLVH